LVVGLAVGLAVGSPVGAAVGFAVGLAVGNVVGLAVGLAVGSWVGLAVGLAVGWPVGEALGDAVGFAVGFWVGFWVGISVGFCVGFAVGFAVGFDVGTVVGLAVGSAVGFLVGFMVGGTVGAIVGGTVGQPQLYIQSMLTLSSMHWPSWARIGQIGLRSTQLTTGAAVGAQSKHVPAHSAGMIASSTPSQSLKEKAAGDMGGPVSANGFVQLSTRKVERESRPCNNTIPTNWNHERHTPTIALLMTDISNS